MKKILAVALVLLSLVSFAACDGGDKQAVLDEAYERLVITLPGNAQLDHVTTSFTVPTELYEGVVGQWTSNSEAATITDRGTGVDVNVVITRGTENQEAKLTCVLTLGSLTATKVFDIVILAQTEEITTVANVSEARNADLVGGLVKIENVTIVNADTDAYYISDASKNVMLVFALLGTAKVGDKGSITGRLAVYYDSYQITEPEFVATATNQTVEPKTVNLSVYDFLGKNTEEILTAKSDSTYVTLIKAQANVVLRSDFTGGGNYQLTLVDPASGTDLDAGFVLIYYKSENYEEVMEVVGKKIEFVATVRELRDSRATTAGNTQPVWSLSVASFTVLGDVSDDLKASIDLKALVFETEFVEAKDVTLPTTVENGNGSVLTYALKDTETVVSIDGNTLKVTLPANGKELFVLVVTATLNGQTATREFEMSAGVLLEQTFTQILSDAVAVGDTVLVKGIVFLTDTASGYANFYITNGEGQFIYIRSGKNPDHVALAIVGDEVLVTAKKNIYQGLVQLDNISEMSNVGTGKTVPTPTVITAVDENTLKLVSSVVTATGVVSAGASDRDYILTISDGVTIALRASQAALLADHVGKTVKVEAILTYFQNGNTGPAQGTNLTSLQISITNASQVVVVE